MCVVTSVGLNFWLVIPAPCEGDNQVINAENKNTLRSKHYGEYITKIQGTIDKYLRGAPHTAS